jgi:hypothetical protein
MVVYCTVLHFTTYEVFKVLKAFENDFLMSHLLHVQLVEIVDGDVEQTAAGDIVVDEEMTVRKY